ncbi:hypothetical protein KAU30_02835 [Candidatus Bathyarchaeota archaeon]|nr:hypothetical protein [Candidatus Bathyarchaeota archaeon]
MNSVLIVGCNRCAGIYHVAGKKEAEIMKRHLETATEIDGDGPAIVKLNGQWRSSIGYQNKRTDEIARCSSQIKG